MVARRIDLQKEIARCLTYLREGDSNRYRHAGFLEALLRVWQYIPDGAFPYKTTKVRKLFRTVTIQESYLEYIKRRAEALYMDLEARKDLTFVNQ